MSYSTYTRRSDAETGRQIRQARDNTPISTGNPFWDIMLSFGKASQQALSGYAAGSEGGTRTDHDAYRVGGDVEVIPIGEETLNVGTRVVAGDTTRVRRVVVQVPVERAVSLREERVIVERRKPTGASATAAETVLTDTAIEMSDSFQVVDVWKSVRITEEVVLRREVTERTETVHETVRHDEVVVEQPNRALAAGRKAMQAEASNAVAATAKLAAEPAKAVADATKAAAETAKAATEDAKPSAGSPRAAAEQQNDKAAQNRKV